MNLFKASMRILVGCIMLTILTKVGGFGPMFCAAIIGTDVLYNIVRVAYLDE